MKRLRIVIRYFPQAHLIIPCKLSASNNLYFYHVHKYSIKYSWSVISILTIGIPTVQKVFTFCIFHNMPYKIILYNTHLQKLVKLLISQFRFSYTELMYIHITHILLGTYP